MQANNQRWIGVWFESGIDSRYAQDTDAGIHCISSSNPHLLQGDLIFVLG